MTINPRTFSYSIQLHKWKFQSADNHRPFRHPILNFSYPHFILGDFLLGVCQEGPALWLSVEFNINGSKLPKLRIRGLCRWLDLSCSPQNRQFWRNLYKTLKYISGDVLENIFGYVINIDGVIVEEILVYQYIWCVCIMFSLFYYYEKIPRR